MIRELREQLVADLAAVGVSIHDEWPDRVTPPVMFVAPALGGSYVTSGDSFGGYVVSVDVTILIRDVDLDALEFLIEGVLANTVDWALVGVETPAVATVNGNNYFGTIVHLSKLARL